MYHVVHHCGEWFEAANVFDCYGLQPLAVDHRRFPKIVLSHCVCSLCRHRRLFHGRSMGSHDWNGNYECFPHQLGNRAAHSRFADDDNSNSHIEALVCLSIGISVGSLLRESKYSCSVPPNLYTKELPPSRLLCYCVCLILHNRCFLYECLRMQESSIASMVTHVSTRLQQPASIILCNSVDQHLYGHRDPCFTSPSIRPA